MSQRDPQADGFFYYSVKTTGVYCRPACAARLALRKNVAFHDSSEAAEAAGFRPCKRCQPNSQALVQEYATKVAAACRAIEQEEVVPSLDALAKAAAISRFHFHRGFVKMTGLTPKAHTLAHRAKRMRAQLPALRSVTVAIYEAGYQSSGRFYAKSAQMLGMKPASFRKGGTGETIRFAVGECALGSIRLAASEKGGCSIALGDDPEKLGRELQDLFPKAQFVGDDAEFEALVAKVIGFVEAPQLGLDLPLAVRGTVFQHRVWQALREIPPGTTSSYMQIAQQIGAPKAVRAVASACAANKLAVAIPCHRVVRTDGVLSGYRWGVERKRALLQKEKAAL